MKSTPALREIDLYRQYLKYVLRDLAVIIFPLHCKLQVCQIPNHLILRTFGHKFRLRSPRITL